MLVSILDYAITTHILVSSAFRYPEAIGTLNLESRDLRGQVSQLWWHVIQVTHNLCMTMVSNLENTIRNMEANSRAHQGQPCQNVVFRYCSSLPLPVADTFMVQQFSIFILLEYVLVTSWAWIWIDQTHHAASSTRMQCKPWPVQDRVILPATLPHQNSC